MQQLYTCMSQYIICLGSEMINFVHLNQITHIYVQHNIKITTMLVAVSQVRTTQEESAGVNNNF